MDVLGHDIFDKRQQFINEFEPIFNDFYAQISDKSENVKLVYDSKLDKSQLAQLLLESINKDRALQYTTVGIHKDDLIFEIGGFPIKKFGSQGQQKTFLIALKLAQFEFLKKRGKEKPILLFDDIFDKLDENRVKKIINMINNDTFGQIILSDTHADRTEKIIKSTSQSYKMFVLN